MAAVVPLFDIDGGRTYSFVFSSLLDKLMNEVRAGMLKEVLFMIHASAKTWALRHDVI